MELIASLLVGGGTIVMVIAVIWIHIVAIQEGDYWILLTLLCGPPVVLFYVYQNFDDLQNQVIVWCGGFVAAGIGWSIVASMSG